MGFLFIVFFLFLYYIYFGDSGVPTGLFGWNFLHIAQVL